MASASAISTVRGSERAFREVLDRVAEGLGGQQADLAAAFVTRHHAEALEQLAVSVLDRKLSRHIFGCTGESIVGDDQEVEEGPAVALWAISLPGVSLKPVRLEFDGAGFEGWPARLGEGEPAPEAALLFLADPYSFPADRWLHDLDSMPHPTRAVGGMASGSQSPGENRLVLDRGFYPDGAVGVVVEGEGVVRTLVSQGCRPIGRPMIITRAEGNIIRELGRKPALEVLRELLGALDEDDKMRVQQGLHVGRVINEYQESFKRGDFLVRNVIGADEQGGIAITDAVRVGQTIQFHVRDADTADQDLREMLAADQAAGAAAGALLFTCNGRGTRLFAEPHHDARLVRSELGSIPLAGFFAMGEVGPVGGQNFLHGYTASLAIFTPKG